MSPAPSEQDDERHAAELASAILGDVTNSRLYYALIDPALAAHPNSPAAVEAIRERLVTTGRAAWIIGYPRDADALGALGFTPVHYEITGRSEDGQWWVIDVPVTPEARKEARELMLSHRNILSPTTGRSRN